MSNPLEGQITFIKKLYDKMADRHEIARKRLGRPITLAEKILFSHMTDPENQKLEKGQSTAFFRPDRVALQDATAQMAILQFILTEKPEVALPTSVHCDHLVRARVGRDKDLPMSIDANKEVYDFLRSASNKYGMGFWKPGSGIIHQIVLENYAFPGGMVIGTDSHTPNAGGLGMIAIGVGGADASEVMSGLPWTVTFPKLIGIKLTGSLSGWATPKDLILKIAGIVSAKGGTGHIVEYFGPGTKSISGTGKATITNMGAEIGATTSVFPYDERMDTYLRATGRTDIADLAKEHASELVADDDVAANPEKYFDRIIEINLDELEPHFVGPFTPDLAHTISDMKADVEKENYPTNLKTVLIGSCTNSSYEDLTLAAHIAKQAKKAGLKLKTNLFISPGSDKVHDTTKRDGQIDALEAIGATVLANACGPCIGQWDRLDNDSGERNSIITTFNRNFRRRNDGNPDTYAFIGSPEMAIAMAFSNDLRFNPLTDTLKTESGEDFRFTAPTGDELPSNGFVMTSDGFEAPAEDGSKVQVIVADDSERLQLLEPFKKWDGNDLKDLVIILKAKGKLTTDHISPAGKWLRYRGHLDKISGNFCEGANNVFTDKTGTGWNVLSDATEPAPLNEVGRAYRKAGQDWAMIGDENYGEGSSREHAAMSPRFLGCRAVVARSFARIAETNLKKQGILPFSFVNSDDYNKITDKTDRISIVGLANLAPEKEITAYIHHANGSKDEIKLSHTLDNEQIDWFKAGSALNYLRTSN